jgi:hexosaminidase
MMNVYDNPAYAAIQKEMLQKLTQLQTAYKDKSYLIPPTYKTLENKAKGCEYVLLQAPAARYQGKGKYPLTDARVENPEFIATGINENWLGFEQHDFDMTMPLNQLKNPATAEIRFLEQPEAWVFQPEKVAFYYTNDKNENIEIRDVLISKEKRASGGIIYHYKVELKDKNIKQLKIKAINRGLCPAGHVGEGKPAWMFTDEVIVR